MIQRLVVSYVNLVISQMMMEHANNAHLVNTPQTMVQLLVYHVHVVNKQMITQLDAFIVKQVNSLLMVVNVNNAQSINTHQTMVHVDVSHVVLVLK